MRGLPFRRPRPEPVAVVIPQDPRFEAVLDEIADAYAACPGEVAALLSALAARRMYLDALVIDPYAEDWRRALAAAEVDGARAGLLDLAPSATAGLDLLLTHREALRFADDITISAATYRLNSTENR